MEDYRGFTAWRGCLVGDDVGGEFSGVESVDTYFYSAGSVVVSGSIVIGSSGGVAVVVEWHCLLWRIVIVVLADDEYGGCVGV